MYTALSSAPILYAFSSAMPCTTSAREGTWSIPIPFDGTLTINFNKLQLRIDHIIVIQLGIPEPRPQGEPNLASVGNLLGTTNSRSGQITSVPEPTFMLLFGTGLGTLGMKRRRSLR